MKYLKLFENWLNEADGGGVKPFDPNNPGATMVVDITQKDMLNLTKDYDKLGDCLSSFLNKGFLKKDSLEGEAPKVSVTKCNIISDIGMDNDAHPKYNVTYISLRVNNEDLGFKDNIAKISWWENVRYWDDKFATLKNDKLPIFLVTLNGFKKEGGQGKYFKPSSKAFFITPRNDDYGYSFTEEKDFALNSEFEIIYDKNCGSMDNITISNLILNIEKMLVNGEKIKDNKPKPQDIAKALGYEIPDNYAPGQGVEKKKA